MEISEEAKTEPQQPAEEEQEKKPRKRKSAVKEAAPVEDEEQPDEAKPVKIQELTIEQIDDLIDLALATKDKAWFEELTKVRKALQKKRKK